MYVVSGDEQPDTPANLDWMLLCPPWIPWEKSPAEIGLAAQGMLVMERWENGQASGIWDIWDWVGEKNYPYFPIFFEEARWQGTSRKIPPSAPIKLLTQQSRHLFVHPKAILDLESMFTIVQTHLGLKSCPMAIEYHDRPQLETGIYDWCTTYLWETVGQVGTEKEDRNTLCALANQLSFKAAKMPYGIKPIWSPAVLAWAPIDRLEVIEDDIDGKHNDVLRLLDQGGCNIPYILETE
jgi:hypothetical protein